MGVYKRGGVYWYKFKFQGISVRESAHSGSKDVASRAERARRLALELGANNLEPVKRPQVFSVVAKNWLVGNPHWSENSRRINHYHCRRLIPFFGNMLLNEIRPDHIARYQSRRIAERVAGEPSNRTINMEVVALRQMLREHKLWHAFQGEVKWLRVEEEVGRALTADELHRLSVAVAKTRSRSLAVALTILQLTGMRLSELRTLRWRQIDLVERPGYPAHILTGKGKTKGGSGRMVPLGAVGLGTMIEWRGNFPLAKLDDYVFPSERYGFSGDPGQWKDGNVAVYDTDPTKPIGTWKTAWTTARRTAGVKCRTHDLRHTFVSALGELGTPEATIIALAGWLSRRMLERYSHTRVQAKVEAIAGVEEALRGPAVPPRSEGAQKWTQ